MNKKKLIAYIIGGTCGMVILIGIILMAASKTVTISTAITIICLIIAFGMICPNHISFFGLIAGICALIFPSWIVGLVLILIGLIAAGINILISKKILKLF